MGDSLAKSNQRSGVPRNVNGFSFPSPSGPLWLQVRYQDGGCHLDVDGEPGWFISRSGAVEAIGSRALGFHEWDAVRQGPVEVLARAMRGQFCLHASAILVKEAGVVAFVGESGVGKSTLARLIQEQNERDWPRIADDVLPVSLGTHGVEVDPAFPQPKLSPEEHYRPDQGPRRLPLTALYRLGPPSGGRAVQSVRARPYEALAIVAGNTMAARLFDGDLLERHLAFSATVAAAVFPRTLTYPRVAAIAPRVVAVIAADLGLGQA